MNISRLINIILITAGAIVALYAQADEQQNKFVLIAGIVLLMLGLYRVSRNIPSKYNNEDTSETEKENEEF